jgi:hypothetical protein
MKLRGGTASGGPTAITSWVWPLVSTLTVGATVIVGRALDCAQAGWGADASSIAAIHPTNRPNACRSVLHRKVA